MSEMHLSEKQNQAMVLLSNHKTIDYLGYGGSKGGGKATCVDAILYTPHGEKRMGDIRIGDLVAGHNGRYTQVIAVHPQGKQSLYRVTFIDGASVLCTLDHLWNAHIVGQTKKTGDHFSTYTTEELIARINIASESKASIKPNILIPLCKGVNFTPVTNRFSDRYIIDPYILGVLLGDGCLTGQTVTFASADEEIINAVSEKYPVNKQRGDYSYSIPDGGKLVSELKDYGLYNKKADTKSIPKKYLISNIEIRKQLIRGLFDTDGYIDDRGHIEFSTISEQLAKDVQWCVRSFGGKATLSSKMGKYKKDGVVIECQKVYRLHISISEPHEYFSLTRKKERGENYKYNNGLGRLCRRIVSIEYEKESEAQCITVRHASGLYLTDDFIVTHNSHLSRVWLYARAKKYPGSTGLLIRKTYQELYRNHTKRFISDFPDVHYVEKKNHIVFPNGSVIDLAYCETERDLERFQGAEYDSIVIDQAEQHKKEAFDLIRSCMRTTNPEIKPKFLLTFNPGGVGHNWLKRMFIQRSFESGDPDPGTVDFLPAKVYDNRWLVDNDPGYVKRLESLPQQMREAYLNGSFDVFEGQFFSLSVNSVEQPWEIPESKAARGLYAGLDHGINHPTCFTLAYLADNGDIHLLFTYLNNGATAYDHAKEILDRITAFTLTHGQMPVKVFYDPSMNTKSPLHPNIVSSPIDQYREVFPKNVIFQEANNNKVHGCQLVKTILAGTHAYPQFYYWPQFNMSFEDGIKSVVVDKNNREVYLKMDGDDVSDCARYMTCGMYAEWNAKKIGLTNRAYAASRIKSLKEKTWQEL